MAPQGPQLVLNLLTRHVPTLLSVYVLLRFSPYDLPKWAGYTVLALAIPFELVTVSLFGAWKQKRDMERLGARPIPQFVSKKWGGLDVVDAMVKEEKDGYLGDFFRQVTEEYGHTVMFKVMGDQMIFTSEPDYIKRVLATDFNGYEKGYRWITAAKSVLGSGVFNADDEMWKFHRAMTRPFFSKERISDFDNFGRHADDALAKLKARLCEGEPVDFQDLVSRFTLDSGTEFLLGHDVNSLSAPLPYSHISSRFVLASSAAPHPSDAFAHSFNNAQLTIAHRSRVGWIWPLAEMFADKTKGDMGVILGFVDPIIDGALAAKKATGGGKMEKKALEEVEAGDEDTLLGHLVNVTDDKEVIRDETINILIAGRDTTAGTLTFLLYMLIQNPHVHAKLREEVFRVVGPSRHPTYEDIKDMKYLRAVINETLRLYPPVPYDVRSSKGSNVWPSKVPGEKPLYIPADTNVNYSAYIMHRSTDFWGPDALVFDPDRFLDSRLSTYLTPNPFIFLPFNAGPRICLGQQFAYSESSFFTVRLIQSFKDFELIQEAAPMEGRVPGWWKGLGGRAMGEEVVLRSHLTMSVKGGMWISAKEVKEGEVVA